MFNNRFMLAALMSVLMGCSHAASRTDADPVPDGLPLTGVNITIDPGHGDSEAYDGYRVGPTGEREEWINLRVAERLARKLESAGANVFMTRREDKDVSLGGRAALAKMHDSHLLVSVHHNGSGNDPGMDKPIVYFFGDATRNPASVDFAQILLAAMVEDMTFAQQHSGAAYSDHLIYSSGTSVLRNTVDVMPGVIGEGGFFTNPEGESRLKDEEYNELEAGVYFRAIVEYFERGRPFATAVSTGDRDFLAPGEVLEFKLDDGFGAHGFQDDAFAVLQDDRSVAHQWDARTGVLSVQPELGEQKKISIRVFGRNLNGNALHPRVFRFVTEKGRQWKTHDLWSDAFSEAEAAHARLVAEDIGEGETKLALVDEALRLYSLSLELQIVHPEARRTEEQILALLQMKDAMVDEDLSGRISAQQNRLKAYYPKP